MLVIIMDCVFCKIIDGSIPSKTIFEDDFVKVIMDINPNSNGHLLVIPKKHYTDFLELDNEMLAHINDTARLMKEKIYHALNPDGLSLHVNYGLYQAVKHYHLHLIPVYKEKQELRSVDEIYSLLMN